MYSSENFISAVAVAVAVGAAMVDVRERRIPNRLTYPAALLGLLIQSIFNGRHGLVQAIAGGLLFGGVFFAFYCVKAMGAGDAKLAAALGCIVGSSASVQVMFATAIFGGVLAVAHTIFSRRIGHIARSTLSVVGFHARFGMRTHPEVNLDNPKAARMPYGVAFAAGTLYWAVSLIFRG